MATQWGVTLNPFFFFFFFFLFAQGADVPLWNSLKVKGGGKKKKIIEGCVSFLISMMSMKEWQAFEKKKKLWLSDYLEEGKLFFSSASFRSNTLTFSVDIYDSRPIEITASLQEDEFKYGQ